MLSPNENALTLLTASGATNNAKAAAIAVIDKIDFVFIVNYLSTKEDINLFGIKPQDMTKSI